MTIIDDTTARRISSEWHGGGGTALYAFASTGAIATPTPACSLYDELIETGELQTNPDLLALEAYAYHHGPRGPVAGWAALTWEPIPQARRHAPAAHPQDPEGTPTMSTYRPVRFIPITSANGASNDD